MKYPFHISNDSITVFNGAPKTVKNGHPNFFRIRAALLEEKYELAYQLMDMPTFIQNASNGDFIVKNGVVSYGNLILNDIISKKLVSIILDGGVDCSPVKNYVEKIIKNPSRNSANELYDFLGYRELAITPEGTVLAWKGVNADLWSKRGNPNTRVLQGKVNEQGQILNEIGATIEVERICVDDNRDNECSHGLHVGSYNYAKGWGERLLLVEFDPADAVSVPRDCEFQKLRVCKYKVIADMTDKKEIKKPIVESLDEAINGDFDADTDTIESKLKSFCDMQYNLWNQADAMAVRDLMARDLRITIMEAWDAIRNYREADVKQKVIAYVERNGAKTVKQIQSSLKISGLTCDIIYDIAQGCADLSCEEGSPLSEQKISVRPQ